MPPAPRRERENRPGYRRDRGQVLTFGARDVGSWIDPSALIRKAEAQRDGVQPGFHLSAILIRRRLSFPSVFAVALFFSETGSVRSYLVEQDHGFSSNYSVSRQRS